MSIVGANVLSNFSNTDATSYATASMTPAANTLYLATFATRTGITANPNSPTLTGAGLTWVLVNSVVHDSSSSSRRRVSVFRSMGSGSAGALTLDEGGQTQTSAVWSVDSFTGVDTSGTNGSGAIVQSATVDDETGLTSNVSVTMAAFGNANNASFGGFANGNPGAGHDMQAGSGFTQLASTSDGEIGNQLLTEWKAANDTGIDVDGVAAATVSAGGIGIEIKAVASAIPTNLFFF